MFVNSLFPIEPAGAIGQAGVESIEMVGGSNDKQAIIPFETIKLIKEKRSVPIVDQTVEVLQYQLKTFELNDSKVSVSPIHTTQGAN